MIEKGYRESTPSGSYIIHGDYSVETWYRVMVMSVGGVLGVNARYWLGIVITRWTGPPFPWATFTINVTGSFAIGLLSIFLDRWLPNPHARLLVVVGFLGGYTTFSSYSFESMKLWERGEHRLCLTYMMGGVAAGFAAVVLGTSLGRGLTVTIPERHSGGVRATAAGDDPKRPASHRDQAEEGLTPGAPAGALEPAERLPFSGKAQQPRLL
jgi:fluoride exporter